MTINGRIVVLRRRLGLSQRAFAERIHRSTAYVNRIENGKDVPTEAILQSISAAFGVPVSWLEKGEGKLLVESVGDRFRRARKARGYTQEELAGELHISRNSVGMIERGTFRPGAEVVAALCGRALVMCAGRLVRDAKPSDIFVDDELMREASLALPPCAALSKALREAGFDGIPAGLSDREALTRAILKCLKGVDA